MSTARRSSTVRYETVNPTVAAEWLQYNATNRPLNSTYLKRLVNEMKTNRWVDAGNPIRFDTAGNLIDGQHRLHAIVKSGVTAEMPVVRGLSPSAFQVIDTGKPRSGADALSTVGVSNARNTSTVCRLLHHHDAGTLGKQAFGFVGNADILAAHQRHPDTAESLKVAYQVYHAFAGLPITALAFCHYVFSRKSPKHAGMFFEQLATGVGLAAGSPVLALRNVLTNRASKTAKFTQMYTMALVIKAWNALVTGRPLKIVKWVAKGPGAEEFPLIEPVSVTPAGQTKSTEET